MLATYCAGMAWASTPARHRRSSTALRSLRLFNSTPVSTDLSSGMVCVAIPTTLEQLDDLLSALRRLVKP